MAGTPAAFDWRPGIFWKRTFLGLLLLISSFLAGIAWLWTYAKNGSLRQSIFTHSSEIRLNNSESLKYTPISIIPTFVAVCIGLWWGAVQQTFYCLHPYLILSSPAGVPLRSVQGSCNPTNWCSSLVKSFCERHMSLFMLVIGCFLCQFRKLIR